MENSVKLYSQGSQAAPSNHK